MAKKRCCFAGHSNIHDSPIKDSLKETLIRLIEQENVTEFWVGNYGSFDSYVSSVLRELKSTYPFITLELVVPYLTKEIDLYKNDYYKNYDNILMANIPESTPAKFRIIKANEFMISNSDFLVCFVNRSYGGAYQSMKFAEKKKISIINLAK